MSEYPSEDVLQYFRTFVINSPAALENYLSILRREWHYEDWGFCRSGTSLTLHTGGWSGNENIIEALEDNFGFWIFWEASRRGGHYDFVLPGPEYWTPKARRP
jgi:hypothetical protein